MIDDPEDVIRRQRKPSIWKLFRPCDVTLYDLIYEPYAGQETYLSEQQGEQRERNECERGSSLQRDS